MNARAVSSFLRFLLVGVFNTCFGYSLIFGFMYLADLSPELSNFLGYAIAILASFVLNKHYTFAGRRTQAADSGRKELLRFLIVFGFAYAANYVVLLLLIYQLDLHAALSQVLAGVVYVGISYLLNAFFVFRYF
ncbi:MAG: GtrA family protein [Pollutimonas bauzanensis]